MAFQQAHLNRISFAAILAAAMVVALATPAPAAQGGYVRTDLVSDVPGAAPIMDPKLTNAWGLTRSATSPWWVANNGSDSSTLYRNAGGVTTKVALEVEVDGAPTGTVFNGTSDFAVTNGTTSAQAARFIFATESGSILGWNPATCPAACPGYSNPENAVFKGLAIGSVGTANYLYATNFKTSSVDVFDSQFHLVALTGMFTDPNMHAGFAPFGIANLGGLLYVSYAKRDAEGHDDVAGPANGFVDVYDTSGNFVRRAATRGRLNSPWGMALAPATFGQFSGDLLVGNFGDGRINAIDPVTGEFLGQLRGTNNRPITIDGLWALAFGGGDASASGPSDSLFFTAGIDDEQHGIFGVVTTA